MIFFRQFFSKARLALSGTYAGSLVSTLYFAMFMQNTVLTILFAVIQTVTLFMMIVAEVPGGATGLRFFTQLFRRSVSTTLPV